MLRQQQVFHRPMPLSHIGSPLWSSFKLFGFLGIWQYFHLLRAWSRALSVSPLSFLRSGSWPGYRSLGSCARFFFWHIATSKLTHALLQVARLASQWFFFFFFFFFGRSVSQSVSVTWGQSAILQSNQPHAALGLPVNILASCLPLDLWTRVPHFFGRTALADLHPLTFDFKSRWLSTVPPCWSLVVANSRSASIYIQYHNISSDSNTSDGPYYPSNPIN